MYMMSINLTERERFQRPNKYLINKSSVFISFISNSSNQSYSVFELGIASLCCKDTLVIYENGSISERLKHSSYGTVLPIGKEFNSKDSNQMDAIIGAIREKVKPFVDVKSRGEDLFNANPNTNYNDLPFV